MNFNKASHFIFVLKKHKFQLLITLLVVVALFFVFLYAKGSAENCLLDNWFAPIIDPVFGISTFILAAIIGYQNMYKSWKSNLDKKLTVHYKIKDNDNKWRYLLSCHKVALSDEADIRSLSQQVGGQMTNNSILKFELNFDEKPSTLVKENNNWVQLYEVCFYLIELPEKYPKEKYKIWWWADKKQHQEYIHNTLSKDIISIEEASKLKKTSTNENITPLKLLNLSNHPSGNWSKEQLNAVKQQFGNVEDMPFPNISPNLSTKELDNLVKIYKEKIVATHITNIHIAGEPTFVFRLVTALKKEEINCYASTTERTVTEKNNQKTSIFQFIKFREY